MIEFATGQHLLAYPEAKRYVLTNSLTNINHLVTSDMIKDAFKDMYDKIMTNRHPVWFAYEYFE